MHTGRKAGSACSVDTPSSGLCRHAQGSDGDLIKSEISECEKIGCGLLPPRLQRRLRWGRFTRRAGRRLVFARCSLRQIKRGFNSPNPTSFKINTPEVKCTEATSACIGPTFRAHRNRNWFLCYVIFFSTAVNIVPTSSRLPAGNDSFS